MRKPMCMVDGKLHSVTENLLPPTDRSFLLGDGLFETIKVLSGKVVWLTEHLERMERSAAWANIPFRQKEDIRTWCHKLVSANEITDGSLRLTVSRGVSNTGRFNDIPDIPKILVTGANATEIATMVKAAFADWPVNERDPSIGHKTTSRITSVKAAMEAAERGMDELVFLNTREEICEGITSNIFWLKEKSLFTPSPECGILPGIARAKLIEAAKELGLYVRSGKFPKKEIMAAEEVFFTNSISIIRPCASLGDTSFRTAGGTAEALLNHIRERFI